MSAHRGMHIVARVFGEMLGRIGAKGKGKSALGMVAFATAVMVTAFPSIVAGDTLTGLDLGTLKQYALVMLGTGTLGQNSGPVVGNELLGQGVRASGFTTGGGALITGTLYYDSTVTSTGNFPATATQVSTSDTATARAEAVSVSDYAAGLTPNNSFVGSTLTGNGGLNVVNVTNISAPFTISGGPDDIFVINVSGTFTRGQNPMNLIGGVDPGHILWNLTGSSGQVFSTSGGAGFPLYGTFLAVNGTAAFQFSNLNVVGAVILASNGNMQFVSGSQISGFAPFEVPAAEIVPLPSSAAGGSCLLVLMGGVIGIRRIHGTRARAAAE